MIVVHHLANSRSFRIVWLLEELEVPYEIRHYDRDPVTRMAPADFKALHPLGKSPLVSDGDRVLSESAAIIDTLIRRHGGGRLQPDPGSPAYDDYVHWLHYAEGSAMAPLMLQVSTRRLGDAAAPLLPRIESETEHHLTYVDAALSRSSFLVGAELTGADIQMSFVAQIAEAFDRLDPHPHIVAWLERLEARPAYLRALAKGGPYRLAAAVGGPARQP